MKHIITFILGYMKSMSSNMEGELRDAVEVCKRTPKLAINAFLLNVLVMGIALVMAQTPWLWAHELIRPLIVCMTVGVAATLLLTGVTIRLVLFLFAEASTKLDDSVKSLDLPNLTTDSAKSLAQRAIGMMAWLLFIDLCASVMPVRVWGNWIAVLTILASALVVLAMSLAGWLDGTHERWVPRYGSLLILAWFALSTFLPSVGRFGENLVDSALHRVDAYNARTELESQKYSDVSDAFEAYNAPAKKQDGNEAKSDSKEARRAALIEKLEALEANGNDERVPVAPKKAVHAQALTNSVPQRDEPANPETPNFGIRAPQS